MGEPLDLYIKSRGKYRRFNRQFYRRGQANRPTKQIFRKEVGVWVLWWPMSIEPVGSISAAFPYRNDVIECDVEWDPVVAGTDIARYEVTVGTPDRDPVTYEVPADTTTLLLTSYTNAAGGWQSMAGAQVVFSVVVVDSRDRRSPPTVSPTYTVPQLPPTPAPYNVRLTVSLVAGTLSWMHVGGNLVTAFQIRVWVNNILTGPTREVGPFARSEDVTSWPLSLRSAGSVVSCAICAIGPRGPSHWVNATAGIPEASWPPGFTTDPTPTPTPTPAPTPVPPPEEVPPPAAVIPGTPVIRNQRFLNGTLRCEFFWPTNSETMEVWWRKAWDDPVQLTSLTRPLAERIGVPSIASIPVSSTWARDPSQRYRISLRARSADEVGSAWATGEWVRKMPLPSFIRPEGTAVTRDGTMFAEGGVLVRQGASENVRRWRGYAAYGGRTRTALHPDYVGYQLTVTRAQVLLERDTTGGSGGPVAPSLYFHTWDYPHQVGTALSTPGALLGTLQRGQWAWRNFSTEYANHLIHPTINPLRIRGLAVYNANLTLNSSLGNVSNEYMRLRGAGAAWRDGHPIWTLKLWHDG